MASMSSHLLCFLGPAKHHEFAKPCMFFSFWNLMSLCTLSSHWERGGHASVLRKQHTWFPWGVRASRITGSYRRTDGQRDTRYFWVWRNLLRLKSSVFLGFAPALSFFSFIPLTTWLLKPQEILSLFLPSKWKELIDEIMSPLRLSGTSPLSRDLHHKTD